MAAYVNDPEGHRPHGPRFGSAHQEQFDVAENGFYQPPNDEQLKLIDELPNRAEKTEFDISIDDFQAWCELNWKKPHGTSDSSDRLIEKLREENQELKAEFYEGKSPEALISELGDILWCVTAIASDLKVNVKHSLLELFYLYGRGTVLFESGQPPEWVKKAQSLTFDLNLSASSLDDMVATGYEPQQAPVMYTDDSPMITDLELEDARNNIQINSMLISSIAKSNYDPDMYQTGETYSSEKVAYLTARIYVDIAFIAQHKGASSLVEVIKANVIKLSERVDKNLIDKTDGDRESSSLY